MALTAVALLGVFVVLTFGRSDSRGRPTPLSGAEVRQGRRCGGWLGLLVPLGLAGLAAFLSPFDPWFQVTAVWSLGLALIGLPSGRALGPVAIGYRTLPPFEFVLAWAVSAAVLVAGGSGAIAVATGTSPLVALYASAWIPIVTISATLPAVVMWAVLLVECQRRTVPGDAVRGG